MEHVSLFSPPVAAGADGAGCTSTTDEAAAAALAACLLVGPRRWPPSSVRTEVAAARLLRSV